MKNGVADFVSKPKKCVTKTFRLDVRGTQIAKVTFKIDGDVFEAGPQAAVRVAGDAFRSVHNDTDDEAELLIFSPRLDEPPTEKQDDFWP